MSFNKNKFEIFLTESDKTDSKSEIGIEGEAAYSSLQYLCSNDIKNNDGTITYTQMLNSKGGIEADLSVTCISKNKFRIITGSGVREHDKKHILRYLDQDVKFTDITDSYSCF